MITQSKKDQEPTFRLLLGLTIALALTLCALEHGWPYSGVKDYIGTTEVEDWDLEVLPPVTTVKDLPKPPKQHNRKVQPQVVTASLIPDLNIVPDNADQEVPELDLGDIDAIVPVEVAVEPEIKVWEIADRMPEFPGGDEGLMEYLHRNLRYPAFAKDNGIEGTLYIKFVIDEKGRVQVDEEDVFRSPHPSLTKEAIRVLKKMPLWKPGRQGPRNVPVYVKLPIQFKMH